MEPLLLPCHIFDIEIFVLHYLNIFIATFLLYQGGNAKVFVSVVKINTAF